MRPRRGRPKESGIIDSLEREAIKAREEMERFERYEREKMEVEIAKALKPMSDAYLHAVREYLHAGGTNMGLGRIIGTQNYYQQVAFRNEVMAPSLFKPELSRESAVMESIREVTFPRVARPNDPRVVYEDAGEVHEVTPIGDELWLLDGEEVEYARVSTIVEAARIRHAVGQQKGDN